MGRLMNKALKFIVLGICFGLITGLAWGGFQYWSITKTGEEAAPRPADVIIVLGAAVWPEGPSPALQARLAHAVALYHEGYAGHLILSGGLGTHPPTEAEAMQVAALKMGVPKDVLHLEGRATNTVENLRFSREIMEKEGWQKAIIVTDSFHIKRALLIARDLGIEASGAPAKNSILYRNRDLRASYTRREVLALTRYLWDRGTGSLSPWKKSYLAPFMAYSVK